MMLTLKCSFAVKCHKRSCFLLLPGMNHDDAIEYCSNLGGRLAEIHDASTNDFLTSWATGNGGLKNALKIY